MNYFFFGGLLWLKYAYVDLDTDMNYAADSLFFRHKVPVRFMEERARAGDKYRIIFCRINRKYKIEFEKALEELNNKMCLLGHNDYEEYCCNLKEELANA